MCDKCFYICCTMTSLAPYEERWYPHGIAEQLRLGWGNIRNFPWSQGLDSGVVEFIMGLMLTFSFLLLHDLSLFDHTASQVLKEDTSEWLERSVFEDSAKRLLSWSRAVSCMLRDAPRLSNQPLLLPLTQGGWDRISYSHTGGVLGTLKHAL
jgi:hypothetical protein